jgi:hypothetical protein
MAIDRRTVPEQTKDAVDAAIKKILDFSAESRNSGLLCMIPILNKKALEARNNIFEYGIALVCNGTDAVEVEDILRNVQSQKEPSYSQKIVDTLYVIGVLGIQRGDHPNTLIQKLDSRVPEKSRSDWLKKRVAEINLKIVDEEDYPRIYLHPEEAETEFEKLASLTDEQIQKLMRDIDSETMAWAVRDNEKIKGVFFHNMSGKAAELLESDIKEIQGDKVLSAQKQIIAAAQKHKFI